MDDKKKGKSVQSKGTKSVEDLEMSRAAIEQLVSTQQLGESIDILQGGGAAKPEDPAPEPLTWDEETDMQEKREQDAARRRLAITSTMTKKTPNSSRAQPSERTKTTGPMSKTPSPKKTSGDETKQKETTSASPEKKKPSSSPSRQETKKLPESDSGSDENDEFRQDLDKLTQRYRILYGATIEMEKVQGSVNGRVEAMGRLVAEQDKVMTRLLKTVESQNDQIRELTHMVTKMEKTQSDTLAAQSADLKERMDNTIKIHQETPELVERLLTRIDKLQHLLPDTASSELKKIVLEPKEKQVLDSIRERTTKPPVKLPKSLRDLQKK